MNSNHEKTGLAAFVLALFGVFTFGIAVIPALICAVISKRQSEAAGVPTDGFATASIVVSGFVLFVWTALIFGFGAALIGGDVVMPQVSIGALRALLIGTGTGVVLVSVLMLLHGRAQRQEEKSRIRQLSGRSPLPRRKRVVR